jgi:hypothetical protein
MPPPPEDEKNHYFSHIRVIKAEARKLSDRGMPPEEVCEQVLATVEVVCDENAGYYRPRLLHLARLALGEVFGRRVVMVGNEPAGE